MALYVHFEGDKVHLVACMSEKNYKKNSFESFRTDHIFRIHTARTSAEEPASLMFLLFR